MVTAVAVLAIGAVTMVLAGAANATGSASTTGSASATGAPPASRGGVIKVVIRPGQSLWSVAESQDPNADTRSVIQQILRLNSLRTDQVQPGQVLWVPRG